MNTGDAVGTKHWSQAHLVAYDRSLTVCGRGTDHARPASESNVCARCKGEDYTVPRGRVKESPTMVAERVRKINSSRLPATPVQKMEALTFESKAVMVKSILGGEWIA